MSRRQERVNHLLRQEISKLLAREVNDPRLPAVISVTRVEVSADLRHAKVLISVLGDAKEKGNALAGLNSAAGFLHRILRQRLSLRHIPNLFFSLDESIEHGQELLDILDSLSNEGKLPARTPH